MVTTTNIFEDQGIMSFAFAHKSLNVKQLISWVNGWRPDFPSLDYTRETNEFLARYTSIGIKKFLVNPALLQFSGGTEIINTTLGRCGEVTIVLGGVVTAGDFRNMIFLNCQISPEDPEDVLFTDCLMYNCYVEQGRFEGLDEYHRTICHSCTFSNDSPSLIIARDALLWNCTLDCMGQAFSSYTVKMVHCVKTPRLENLQKEQTQFLRH